MTRFKTLLVKYINLVGAEEGVDFISRADPSDFTSHEIIALKECAELADQYAKQKRERAKGSKVTTYHSSHNVRMSDSSHYDEKCTQCGATDMNPGLLQAPCVNAPAPAVDYDKLCAAAIERFPQVHKTLAASEKPCPEVTEIVTPLAESLAETLYEELSDAYYCNRVWEAWSVGTMRSDDFSPAEDRADEIVGSIMKKIAEHPAIKRAMALEAAMNGFPSLAQDHGPFDPAPVIHWYRTNISPLVGLPTLKENIDAV